MLDPSRIESAVALGVSQGFAVMPLLVEVGGALSAKDAFFCAVKKTVPLDPPVHTSWDALDDSMWSGLYSMSSDRLLIFWRDATEFERQHSDDFAIILDMLQDIARTLFDPEFSERRKELCILIGVEGRNNR